MPDTVAETKPRYHGLRVSREEYLDLEEDGFRYDVVDGVMVMAPSPSFQHGNLAGSITGMLYAYFQQQPLGVFASETDVFLPDDGDVVRPDISMILNENLHIVKTHIHGAPDMVFEILSPSTRHRDLGDKAERYLKGGVKEYWIIDPADETLHLWINQGDVWKKKQGNVLESGLLPGFQIETGRLWK
ncbi:MAG: Uma2 family endonuclease [Spirochaetes bacterium]|nr:Uma2 family endonuclease [Spirochaetota bacterium]